MLGARSREEIMHGARGNGINSAFEQIRMLRARARLFAENWDFLGLSHIYVTLARRDVIVCVGSGPAACARASALFVRVAFMTTTL